MKTVSVLAIANTKPDLSLPCLHLLWASYILCNQLIYQFITISHKSMRERSKTYKCPTDRHHILSTLKNYLYNTNKIKQRVLERKYCFPGKTVSNGCTGNIILQDVNLVVARSINGEKTKLHCACNGFF